MSDFNDKYLLFSLIHEFSYGKVSEEILSEERSVVPNIDNIVDSFLNGGIIKQVVKVIEYDNKNYFGEIFNTSNTEVYTKKNIVLPSDCFFSDFYLELTVKKSKDTHYNGGLYPLKSFIKMQKGFVFKPYIKLNMEGNSSNIILEKISIGLSHELTHAYDYYMYFKKNGFPQSVNDFYKAGTQRFNNAKISNNGVERVIGDIMYRLSQKELNAYLGQLRTELKFVATKIQDAKTAFKAIKETSSYQKTYKFLEDEISYIVNNVEREDYQHLIIKYTNSVANKNFTNYQQVVKYYFNRWYKWSETYLTKASKIAFDVFSEFSNIGYEDDKTNSLKDTI